MTDFFDIHPRLLELSRQAEELCVGAFARIAENEEYNGQKVLAAFRKAGVSEAHLKGTTGYGYDDRGREGLDTIFAAVFGAEDALVRHTFVSGTHALATALFGVLRPGELLVSVTGAPYDTLEETIGIRGDSDGSLMDWGVKYRQVELLPDGAPDFAAIAEAAKEARVIYIQRSRGYSLRPSLTVEVIG